MCVNSLDDPHGRGEHRSPAKNHKETFLFSYFCMTKSTKSHLRGLSSLLKNTFRVHELFARSSAWQVCAANGGAKVGGFMLSATSYYHACEHITRESRADSCTHCLHARYKCRAGVYLICALTGWNTYFLLFLLAVLGFYIVGANIVRPQRYINQPSPYSPLDLSLRSLVHFRHGENFLCEGRSGGALFHAPAPVPALLTGSIHAGA